MTPPAIAPAAELCDGEGVTVGADPTALVTPNVAGSDAWVVKPAAPEVALVDVVILEGGI